MIFFSADLHLQHVGLLSLGVRPQFSSIEEMNEAILVNINAVVGKSDSLYILGDFCLGKKDVVAEFRKKIACPSVFLIRGNHDNLSDGQYKDAGFIYKGDLATIKIDGQTIVLCHYAMRRWEKSHAGSWMLFGHSHGQLADDPLAFSFDVGVDCHDFKPLSFDRVKEIMAGKTAAFAAPNHPREYDELQCSLRAMVQPE